MGVRAKIDEKNKGVLLIEVDIEKEGSPLEVSGSGNTMKVGGFGAPLQTGVKYEYEGKKYELTAQVNVWIPNPARVAAREAEKAAKKAGKGKGGDAPAAEGDGKKGKK